jgi:hypothetical protein
MASITAIERNRMAGALPALVTKEAQLREQAATRLGIEYVIPAYGGVRTEAQVRQLIQWRDEAVQKAKDTARKAGATAAAIEEAGRRAYYRVASANVGLHPVGAAFDVRITKFPGQGGTYHTRDLNRAYNELGNLGESLGMKWGGRFRPSPDVFHFELYGARDLFAQQFTQLKALAMRALAGTAGKVAALAIAFTVVTRYLR